jgi:hypothetical protein
LLQLGEKGGIRLSLSGILKGLSDRVLKGHLQSEDLVRNPFLAGPVVILIVERDQKTNEESTCAENKSQLPWI